MQGSYASPRHPYCRVPDTNCPGPCLEMDFSANCGNAALLAACGSVCQYIHRKLIPNCTSGRLLLTVYIDRNKMPFFKTYGGFHPAPIRLPSGPSLVEAKSILLLLLASFRTMSRHAKQTRQALPSGDILRGSVKGQGTFVG